MGGQMDWKINEQMTGKMDGNTDIQVNEWIEEILADE